MNNNVFLASLSGEIWEHASVVSYAGDCDDSAGGGAFQQVQQQIGQQEVTQMIDSQLHLKAIRW